jgi:methylated-DNA-[protein]-cysteine S-methyltransferase
MSLSDYTAILPAPFARLGVMASESAIQRIDFLLLDGKTFLPSATCSSVALLAELLENYWQDAGTSFARLPCQMDGTPYQHRVWQALTRIPCGQTLHYGALAMQLGSGARAIGQACGANPLPVVVPCHRVVAKQGKGGFMHCRDGAALDYKTWLLQHEASGKAH